MPKIKVCKDCRAENRNLGKPRPAPYPGPRCATHQNINNRRVSNAAHKRHMEAQYNLSDDEYAALLAIQGGACAGCGVIPGPRAKRLAVDHDHTCCRGKTSCGKCVRGLLCYRCNDTLSKFGDNPNLLRSLASYVDNWPSWKLRGLAR